MESKEKQRIYAQTFVPSVERFDDNPSLIQLASKARDKTSMPDGNATKPAFKFGPPKKSMSNFSPPLATRMMKSPDISAEKPPQECVSGRYFQKNGNNKLTTNSDTAIKSDSARFFEDASPRCTQDVKHGTHILPTRRTSPFSKPVSPYKNQRQITSISACMYAPNSKPTEMKAHPAAFKPHTKDHMSSMELQARNIPVASAEDKTDLKEATQQMRFFRSQSERSKLERNRGNQKLPVGIAVARQRQHTTPTKPRNMMKSGSPDLGRYHEHALNQEREVLLRENKELSNYTSRLQTGSTNPSLPMLNLPNAMLPGSWEREQAAFMSSFLQWQARQAQSSLLGSGLQHPSVWLGGASPYHFPGSQTGSSLASAQASTSGYPLLSSGLSGGFVIMPQFLQEAGAAGMWPSLSALYRSTEPTPTNLSNPFHNLLSQRLDLQHSELQALQQQTMLQHGIPFPLHKNDRSLPDEWRSVLTSQFPSELRTPDGDRLSHSPYRLDTSPKNIRRDATPSWTHSDRYQRSPMLSPPTRTPTFQPKTAHGADTPPTVHAKSENIPLNIVKKRSDEVEHLPKQQAILITKPPPQILDLTSLPEDYSSVCSSAKTVKNEVKNENLSPIITITPQPASKEEKKQVLLTDFNLAPTTDKSLSLRAAVAPVKVKAVENVSDIVKPQNAIIPENTLIYHKPHVSSGVELLTKAADIHLQNMTADTQPTSKRIFSERPSSLPPRLFETTEKYSDEISLRTNNENKPETPTTPPEIPQEEIERVDIATLDPDVLDAVRGITLLSQSFSQQQQRKMDSAATTVPMKLPASTEQSQFDTERYREPHPSMSDCNDDVQSTFSFSSITDSAIISGDCMSGSELKEQDTSEKARLKRKLKKTISKLKLGKDEGPIAGATFKLDSMDAKEIDMKMRLADLQRRYKEKQKELAKIQRKNKREKHNFNNASTNTIPLTLTSPAVTPCPYASPKFKFGETTPLAASQPAQKNSTTPKASKHTISQGMFLPKRKKSSDSDKDQAHIAEPTLRKNQSESFFASEVTTIEKVLKDNAIEPASGHQRTPSGSRKRKPEKPKRICLPTDETPTVPLVQSSKKNPQLSTPVNNIHEDHQSTFPDKSEKKRKRKMKHAAKKIKLQDGDDPASSSWVFKSKSKSEKHEGRMRIKSDIEKANSHKPPKSPENANLSNNNNKRKKTQGVPKEILQVEPSAEPEVERIDRSATPLELKEEDLVKGLQVLVPLEDKLLYLCQINPIQPPDIYEVTVEGERHRHRPIVMCLEQILKEAVPDVKPRSTQELCEGSRVAAYWSHKMHCLYTGTITFDDSDDEDGENKEGMIQVEFDDGDSSMIALDDIRLLPKNYPIMQPDAPFMMHYVHRRRNTSDTSGRDTTKSTQGRTKKNINQGGGKKEVKSRKKSEKLTSKLQKRSLDLSAYDYPSNDDVDQPTHTPMPRKRATSLKVNAKLSSKPSNAESSTSSVSSVDEDSDTVFSDSGDDTYEGDDGDGDVTSSILPKYRKNRHDIQDHSNELWAWHDKDVQKKAVKGKAKKIYHKSIRRGDEVISCGDSAVFLSAGRLYLPYIGRIESMWESWGNNMVVKVRWFYHPEETKRGRLKSHGKHPLYKSSHIDENDVQTISHKCEVVSFKEYCRRMRNDEQNVFYCAGTYDPATGQVIQEHTDKRKHLKS